MCNSFILIVVSAAATLLGGCRSTAAVQDAGGSDLHLFSLGTGTYVVAGPVVSAMDECNLGMGIIPGKTTFDLVVDNSTGRASLTETGSVATCTAGLGCGIISDNGGTLTANIPAPVASMCIVNKMVTSLVQLVADKTFTLMLTHTETERMGCTDPSDSKCTSEFMLTLTPLTSDAGN